MKAFTVSMSVFLALFLIVAQNGFSQGPHGARGTDSAAPARGTSAASAGIVSYAGSAGAAPAASSAAASSAAAATSGGYVAGSYAGPSYGGYPSGGMVPLNYTSFGSIGTYYSYNNYYSYLCSHYNMSPFYFNRFYRHTEPLITPGMLKLTLRTPIRLSSEMLDSIDQLEAMLKDAQEGKAIDKQALLVKSKRIRELAKQIRKNQTLTHFDLRDSRDLSKKEDEQGALSLEALGRMREMAVDLDRQLRNMYSQSATSTVSVESYSEPSLESLAKGIEKLCKAIEKSSKRM